MIEDTSESTRTIATLPDKQTAVLLTGGPYSLSDLPLIGGDIAAAGAITVSINVDPSGPSISGSMTFGSSQPMNFSLPPTGPVSGSSGGVQMSSTSDGTVWFTVQQTWGSTVMEKIGAKYLADQNAVWFEIDATINVDVLMMQLQGLGMLLTIGQSSITPSFTIQGGAVTFNKSPLTLSGALVNLAQPGSSDVDFGGELTVGASKFTAQIAGAYSQQGNPSFPSAFLFADLATQFGGPPSFSVTAAALGGGFNSALTVPTIDQVADFPFLKMLGDKTYLSAKPIQVLDTMLGSKPVQWVSSSKGAWWGAAGINASSFNMITTDALLVVEDSSELVIALIGQSSGSFPNSPALQKALGTYAYVELDLLARLAPSEGVFAVQAQLSPNSYLLSESCVLTGGFAFFSWFGSNPNAGDFVLTLGGYNPGFVVPSYYPTVPQVGFDWSLDSSISISGGAYFALTPAAFMVGGDLDAVYRSGNLKAWFDAHADMLVQWVPFQFKAGIGINIGASYTLDFLGATMTMSVELGCDLELWGPPTGGTVSVDWSIISFTIPFGEQPQSAGTMSWTDVQGVLPPSPVSIAPAAGLTASVPANISSTNDDGDPTPPTWIVRAGKFAFNTSSAIPANSYDAGQAGQGTVSADTFNVVPLDSDWQGVTATHAVQIQDANGNDITQYFTVTSSAQGKLPGAIWGTQQSSPLAGGYCTGLSIAANAPAVVNASPNIPLTNLEGGTLPGVPVQFGGSPSIAAPGNPLDVVSTIADGIASQTNINARTAIFNALTVAIPNLSNDDMTHFASDAGSTFTAEPMLV